MPSSDDLSYQPVAETQSFQAQSKNAKSFPNFLITLIASVIVLMIFFLILNFFNIISLSTLYPNQFGFLPHLNSKNSSNQQNNSAVNTKKTIGNSPTKMPTEKIKPQFIKGVYQTASNNQLTVMSGSDTKIFKITPSTLLFETKGNLVNLTSPSASVTFIQKIADMNGFIKLLNPGETILRIVYIQNNAGLIALEVDCVLPE